MNYRFHITPAALLVFFSVHANAQFGRVVVHSDPRLAVLLKKNPVAAPPPTPVPNANARRAAKPGSAAAGETPEPININEDAPPSPLPFHRDGKVVYAGRGFRVQIYNGHDREKAIKVRAEFLRTNPDTRAYFSYVSPSFRVKVGDYRTREQAERKLKEVKSDYPTPWMIVPDMIAVHEN